MVERRPWWEIASDENAPRRWVLYVVALTMIAGGLLFGLAAVVLWLQGSGPILDVTGAAGIVVLGGVVYLLARRGRLLAAGVLMILLLTLIPTYFLVVEGPKFAGILFFAGGVVFADLVIGGRIGLVMAAINSLLYLGIGLAHQFHALSAVSVPGFASDLCAVVVMILGLALATGLFSRGMRQAIHRAKVQEEALRAVDQEKTHLLAELQSREESQRRLLETVRDLSSPVIPLGVGIIAVPIIGTVDSGRAQQIRATLLRAVAKHRARVVVLDVTGVTMMDTAVAQALLQTAQGVEFLGARPVLVGIRSEVAQTLVEMGVDMTGVVTRATLQEGLEYGRAVVRGLQSGTAPFGPAGGLVARR
jgi:anti-anti-sigma factor